MLVDCAGFYSRDRAKQRLEHFLERERADGIYWWIRSRLKKILRRGIKNDLTFLIQQLDLGWCHY